jgi:hypothetical protein
LSDEFAFSFDPQGWNYNCSIIADYKKEPTIKLEQTEFFRFFNNDTIRSIKYLNELLYYNNPSKISAENAYNFYLGTWPWGGMTENESIKGGTPFGHHYDKIEGTMTRDLWGYGRTLWYKPDDRYTLEFEMKLTIDIYKSIKRGYNPLYHNSFPSATLLKRSDGQFRALIYDGDHRLAALSQLGHKKVTVEVVHIVKEAEAGNWYYVRNGYCTKEEALEIFNAFFELNGKERLIYLGLDK